LPHAVIQHALVQIVVSVHDFLVGGSEIQWGCPLSRAPRRAPHITSGQWRSN
jgi:hypothetical protein